MNKRFPLYLGGAALLGVGGYYGYVAFFGDYRTLKTQQPDEQPTPGKTGYKLVDKLLPRLKEIASQTGIPLGLMVAWIAKESGGKLSDHTSLDERGYYQLMPEESKHLGLDHQRLSTDSDYSLDAGTKLIRDYQGFVNDLNLSTAPAGSALYWIFVKLGHTVGKGRAKTWIKQAQGAGHLASWPDFRDYIMANVSGSRPKKWLPFLDSIYALGKPFGFGTESTAVVGCAPLTSCVVGDTALDLLGVLA